MRTGSNLAHYLEAVAGTPSESVPLDALPVVLPVLDLFTALPRAKHTYIETTRTNAAAATIVSADAVVPGYYLATASVVMITAHAAVIRYRFGIRDVANVNHYGEVVALKSVGDTRQFQRILRFLEKDMKVFLAQDDASGAGETTFSTFSLERLMVAA